MEELKRNDVLSKMDTKELELPLTSYIRDIESKVFQGIVLKCLSKIKGIGLMEGNLFENLLGRDTDKIKGIHVEQDLKKYSVFIKVEINIAYGYSIPEKAEEIQNQIIKEIITYTGLHVSCVHVIFKNLISEAMERIEKKEPQMQEEYTLGF